jgi:hypothetical protein
MNTLIFEYTSLLGTRKSLPMYSNEKEKEELAKIPLEALKTKCQAICNEYSLKGFWTEVLLDNVKIASQQPADL